jgi:hypothetical protein
MRARPHVFTLLLLLAVAVVGAEKVKPPIQIRISQKMTSPDGRIALVFVERGQGNPLSIYACQAGGISPLDMAAFPDLKVFDKAFMSQDVCWSRDGRHVAWMGSTFPPSASEFQMALASLALHDGKLASVALRHYSYSAADVGAAWLGEDLVFVRLGEHSISWFLCQTETGKDSALTWVHPEGMGANKLHPISSVPGWRRDSSIVHAIASQSGFCVAGLFEVSFDREQMRATMEPILFTCRTVQEPPGALPEGIPSIQSSTVGWSVVGKQVFLLAGVTTEEKQRVVELWRMRDASQRTPLEKVRRFPVPPGKAFLSPLAPMIAVAMRGVDGARSNIAVGDIGEDGVVFREPLYHVGKNENVEVLVFLSGNTILVNTEKGLFSLNTEKKDGVFTPLALVGDFLY